jgi:hypothetical protein
MSESPPKRIRVTTAWALAALLGALPLAGCGHPAEGTVQIAPGARHLGADPVTKQRRDAAKSRPKDAPVAVEPGKLPPGHGRMSD